MNSVEKREKTLKKLEHIAFGKSNGAVMLAMTGNTDKNFIRGLDLSLLSEVKRTSNGSVEMKFFSRLEAIKLLIELLKDNSSQERDSAEEFLRAISAAGGGSDVS